MADFGNIAGLVKSFTQPLESDLVTPKTSVLWAKEKTAGSAEVTIMRYDFVNSQWVPLSSEESVYKVDAATDVNQAFTGVTEIDGLTLVNGSKVLLYGQTTVTQNGIYESDGAGALTRIARYSTTVLGDHLIIVHSGQNNALKMYMPVNSANLDGFTIGVDAITYKVVNDPVAAVNAALSAAGGADGVITKIQLVGNILQVTGLNGAFNGNIDLTPITSSSKYQLVFVSGDFSSEQITIPGVTHGKGVNPIVQVIDDATDDVVGVDSINIDPANGNVTITVGVGLEFDGRAIII